ncbi:MAG: GNAT family N-acetyltransferase [Anaerolineales bacterium]|nr:MAG: GNAT family N-acetyltransferase [Anaerolineales bacterium]
MVWRQQEQIRMNARIRPVDPDEADALSQIAFSAKGHWNYPEHWLEIWRPQLTFTPDYFEENESWAAEADGAPVGFYTIQNRNGNAWIENLWVLPGYIGRGVGRRLFLHALSRSRQKGYLILQLEADPNALGFYERMGMRKIGERRSEVEGQPRILPVMEIELRELA